MRIPYLFPLLCHGVRHHASDFKTFFSCHINAILYSFQCTRFRFLWITANKEPFLLPTLQIYNFFEPRRRVIRVDHNVTDINICSLSSSSLRKWPGDAFPCNKLVLIDIFTDFFGYKFSNKTLPSSPMSSFILIEIINISDGIFDGKIVNKN